jgi:acetyltransferase-like isoleucine patch superfamily enzyme
MARHRNLAVIHRGASVLSDGWILNPEGTRKRIEIGANSIVRAELFVFPHSGSIRIGEWCFIGPQSHVWSAASVTIGDRVLISHQVNIHDTNGHSLNASLRHQQFVEIATSGHPINPVDIAADPVTIGNDAWIGFGSSILKGVTIGEGAVIAARSVVTDDVEPWTVVAGFPARPVRKLERPSSPILDGRKQQT